MTDHTLNVHIPTSTGPITVTADGLRLASEWAAPRSVPAAPTADCWAHRGRRGYAQRLAGRAGQVVEDVFGALDWVLIRRVWLDARGDAVAIRHTVRNVGAMAYRLDALEPVRVRQEDGLSMAGCGPDGWDVLAQQRLKNGIPSALRPGVYDTDYAHATKGATETGGLVADGGTRVGAVEMDPFCLLRARHVPESPVLLAGFLSQTGHCARWQLRWRTEQDTRLEWFGAECEFDGCVVPPGGERSSQWCLLSWGERADQLVSDFAERVATYHGIKEPPQPPPTVYCSWQYYGSAFTEADLIENLDCLDQDRVPFDVCLIDECWDTAWGDWEANADWPSGMAAAAARIRASGYVPGIWTCPFLADTHSRLAGEHPEWLLRLEDGEPHTFYMDQAQHYVLDPTFPGVCDHLEALFRRLTEDWGYPYHKLDFTRAVFVDKRVRFYDASATRLEAYRRGLEAVRRGAGPDAYISVCGGHYGGALGIADSQRSGSDVVACWDDPPALPKFKQNLLRTWMNRLWHVDADAMMVRRRDEPINDTRHGMLSLGKFSDDEAVTIAINQYLGGGLVCLCERFAELEADRRALYRHVIPALGAPAVPLDPFEPLCPSYLVTEVEPSCAALGHWVTVAVINWGDEPQVMRLMIDGMVVESLAPQTRFVVFDLVDQAFLGLWERGQALELGLQAPHCSRLLRLAPWDGTHPVLVGTDLHYSGGGVEVHDWQATDEAVVGRIDTSWTNYPVRVSVVLPDGDECCLREVVVMPGTRDFTVRR